MTDGGRPLAGVRPVPAATHLAAMARAGARVVHAAGGATWVGGERGALVRFPTWETAPVPVQAARAAARAGRAAVVSYLQPAGADGSTAVLYAARDHAYALGGLEEASRRHVRRALRELTFSVVDRPTLLAAGSAAFCETRGRTGLSDGTRSGFEARFAAFFASPAHHVFGAWRGDQLVAYFTLLVVDEWVEIGGFSQDQALEWRPNNGLVHHIQQEFLAHRASRLVSYGLSSLQQGADVAGLDRFKRKVGFRAEPVRRHMVLHPVVDRLRRPIAAGLTVALRARPHSRWLRKADGALRLVDAGPGAE